MRNENFKKLVESIDNVITFIDYLKKNENLDDVDNEMFDLSINKLNEVFRMIVICSTIE